MVYKIYNFISGIFDNLNSDAALVWAYLFFIVVMLLLPLWATLSSHLAGKKGRSPGLWFLIGMFGSFITPIIIIFLKPREDFIKPSKCLYNWTCPECWHSNDENSVVCENCGAEKPKHGAE